MQVSSKIAGVLILAFFISCKCLAITTYPTSTTILVGDTSEKAIKKAANKQAHRAALCSTILPGLGQAYNKKFWKIPIVYAALAAGSYLVYYENNQYQSYHNELLYRYNHNQATNDPILKNLSTDNLNTEKLVYQKYRDFSIIGVAIIYVLNIIDASVDGHFKTFDVSDNLSLRVKPQTFYCAQSPLSPAAGISLSLTFK
jgi:hypothetical protein